VAFWPFLLSSETHSTVFIYSVGTVTYGGKEPSRHMVVVRPRQPVYSLTTKFQTRFLESIPRPKVGPKFPTLFSRNQPAPPPLTGLQSQRPPPPDPFYILYFARLETF
jgi:hypothetical protein